MADYTFNSNRAFIAVIQGGSAAVILDSIVTLCARHQIRREIHFSGESEATGIPLPKPNQSYFLYLHVPFCEVLCPFCSFHKVEFEHAKAANYFEALRTEIQFATDLGYHFDEVYVGGGTPTVQTSELGKTIEFLRGQHVVKRLSVETNPAHLDADCLAALKSIGVNRLSVGVQSFDNQILKKIKRYDKYGDSTSIQKGLKETKGIFSTLNVDMIFNFPGATAQQLQRDLDILTEELSVDQVSFYPLMVGSSTRKFLDQEMGGVDYGRERAFYEQIAIHMLSAGYKRSSAWCFSQNDGLIDEYIADRDEYLGLGSGSFSYLDGAFFSTTFSIPRYLNLVNSGRTGFVRRREMSGAEKIRYYLLTHLFGGVLDLREAESLFDGEFLRRLWLEIAGLKLIGAVRREGDRLQLTEAGYYLWVLMMREFLIGVNSLRDEMRQHISQERIGMSVGA